MEDKEMEFAKRVEGHDIYKAGEKFIVYAGASRKIRFDSLEKAIKWCEENSLKGFNFINR